MKYDETLCEIIYEAMKYIVIFVNDPTYNRKIILEPANRDKRYWLPMRMVVVNSRINNFTQWRNTRGLSSRH